MDDAVREELSKIGNAVRVRRRKMGFSQEEFAEHADIHRTYAGAIERGEVNVSWQNISRVARALRLRPSTLLARAKL